MNNIAICIPTYKRPSLLEKLLNSIIKCDIEKSLISDVYIIIVDNDVDKTAEAVVREFETNVKIPFKLFYFSYSVKGLANVRNELLRKAFEKDPDYIVFIDDDEYPDHNWLNQLICTIVRNNGDMARGPVISVFDESVPESIKCWFERPDYKADSRITKVATNNLAIKTKSLLKFNVWFDERFNYTGSEDSYFGWQMMKHGSSLFWSADSPVYETIPSTRTNLKWIMRRRYMGGSNFVYKLKLDKKYFSLTKKCLISLIYFIIGGAALIFTFFPIKRKYWGALKVAEGIGGIAGLVNIRKTAY